MMRPDQLQTKNFWVATGWRSLRTFAQSLLSLISVNATDLLTTNAPTILVTSLVASLVSVLTSIVAGIPEAPKPDPIQPPESGYEQ